MRKTSSFISSDFRSDGGGHIRKTGTIRQPLPSTPHHQVWVNIARTIHAYLPPGEHRHMFRIRLRLPSWLVVDF